MILRSVNGLPSENLIKVIELMGGIEKLIGSEDIVLIKPNVQWWNQGAPNLASLKAFIDLVMGRPGERPGGFRGEVVVAENCHRGSAPWASEGSGWAHLFERNSDLQNVHQFNEFCVSMKRKYGGRFSAVHWIDVKSGGRRVYSPGDGAGYVYCDGTKGVPLFECTNGAQGEQRRSTVMTYP